MSMYLIGDIQGCDAALAALMRKVGFSPSRDTLYLLGDLVNRGPASAQVVRRAMAGGDAIRSLLGNHDLHLLAVAEGVRKPHRADTLADLLADPDSPALLDWLRHQPLAYRLRHGQQELLLVHAGVQPQWTAADTLARAAEVEAQLQGPDLRAFLSQVFGNTPGAWSDDLQGIERLRVIVNTLTRLRFCHPDGRMDFEAKEGAAKAPEGLVPWFDLPGRRTQDQTVAFGHWSTLGWIDRPRLLSLDTGCVWGGCLTAVKLGATAAENERIDVECEQAQVPG